MKRLLEILLGILLQVTTPKLAEEGGKTSVFSTALWFRNQPFREALPLQTQWLESTWRTVFAFPSCWHLGFGVWGVRVPSVLWEEIGRYLWLGSGRIASVFEVDLLVFTILLCFIHAPYLSGLSLSVLPLSFSSPTPGPPVALYTLAHLSKGLLWTGAIWSSRPLSQSSVVLPPFLISLENLPFFFGLYTVIYFCLYYPIDKPHI